VVEELICSLAEEHLAPPIDREGAVRIQNQLRLLGKIWQLEEFLDVLVDTPEDLKANLGNSFRTKFDALVLGMEENQFRKV